MNEVNDLQSGDALLDLYLQEGDHKLKDVMERLLLLLVQVPLTQLHDLLLPVQDLLAGVLRVTQVVLAEVQVQVADLVQLGGDEERDQGSQLETLLGLRDLGLAVEGVNEGYREEEDGLVLNAADS